MLLSSERAKRPNEFVRPPDIRSPAAECPFCPGNEHMTPPEVLSYRDKETGGWRLRVVPNKYPAMLGGHEVIIESPRHDAEIGPDLFEAVRERIGAWKAQDELSRYAQFFKNSGSAAGASIEHAHSQLVVLPMVPKRIEEELDGAKAHFEAAGRCLFCCILEKERNEGSRMIFETSQVQVFAPWAPRFAFETWIVPKPHGSHFEHAEPDLLNEVTFALRVALGMLERAAGRPAYNLILHTAPIQETELAHYHWHLELLPRIAALAGFELATGCYINAIWPEDSAELLRKTGQAETE